MTSQGPGQQTHPSASSYILVSSADLSAIFSSRVAIRWCCHTLSLFCQSQRGVVFCACKCPGSEAAGAHHSHARYIESKGAYLSSIPRLITGNLRSDSDDDRNLMRRKESLA